jgi:hypothetical protein
MTHSSLRVSRWLTESLPAKLSTKLSIGTGRELDLHTSAVNLPGSRHANEVGAHLPRRPCNVAVLHLQGLELDDLRRTALEVFLVLRPISTEPSDRRENSGHQLLEEHRRTG